MRCSGLRPLLAAALGVAVLGAWCARAEAQEISVTTYHNDNTRSGWNQNETTLTPSAVSGGNFGMIASTALDDQVDAQPLVVPNETIAGGTHDVVYVATESDTVYAIDADSGQVLLSNHLGTPVPYTMLPGQCNNNGANIGINSTPVIDPNAGLLYLITYTLENNNQTFRIHALSLTTLQDTVPSVVISASGKLDNGRTYQFQPASTRQRPALLLSAGTIYAGFGSYCDFNANVSRGWVLGWQTGSLTPLAANHLNNVLASSPDDFFLTSIWMSGYGLAADTGGDVYLVTGNSDYSGNTYNKKTNLSESVVELSSDLTKVEDFFTPGGPGGAGGLDREDGDFGSGGLTLLPPQSGKFPGLAVATGKAGLLYLMNAEKLGKDNSPLGQVNVGGCWCGASYFINSSNVTEVVASGGGNVNFYTVKTGKQKPSLVHAATSGNVPDGQDPGFFTSVSSNGTQNNSAVIWAVSRPTDGDPADIYLYAFGQNGNSLYSGLAGTWPNVNGNSNTVPTVANGRVYVASYQSLAIFGLNNGNGPLAQLPATKVANMQPPLPPGMHEIYGMVSSMNGNLVSVTRRDGSRMTIDTTVAERNSGLAEPSVGNALKARGTMSPTGIFEASLVMHAKNNPAMWFPDR